MEVGEQYDKKCLHGKKYFAEFLERLQDVPDSVIYLLKLSRTNLDMFKTVKKQLLYCLQNNLLIKHRVELLMTFPSVGEVTALT